MEKKTKILIEGPICSKCAYSLGFKPKDGAVGVWFGICDQCQEERSCTDASHDWLQPGVKRPTLEDCLKFLPEEATIWDLMILKEALANTNTEEI